MCGRATKHASVQSPLCAVIRGDLIAITAIPGALQGNFSMPESISCRETSGASVRGHGRRSRSKQAAQPRPALLAAGRSSSRSAPQASKVFLDRSATWTDARQP